MPRKRTKEEALERLASLPRVKGSGRVGAVDKFARLGAAGLIMLDPLNRLADERIVLPLDMVCIPAYQAFMIQGTPSLQIYVRAGETILPTGGNVKDVEEALSDRATETELAGYGEIVKEGKATRKRITAYQKKYKKAFKSLAPKYKNKNGKWKKDGFKRCVKEAHRIAGGKK